MDFTSEINFLLITLAALGIVLVSAVLGRYWLHSTIVVFVVFVTFTAGKLVMIFGFTASLATPVYAGIFLASDALNKCYGPNEARISVWKGFLALLCVAFLGQLVESSPSLEGDHIALALHPLFAFIPSLFLGSSLAYIVSQNVDIWIFGYLNERFKGKRLWLSNNLSTIVAQLLDSIIVYAIAFSTAPNLLQIILVAWVMKIFVAICDTPFLYLILAYTRKGNNSTVETAC